MHMTTHMVEFYMQIISFLHLYLALKKQHF